MPQLVAFTTPMFGSSIKQKKRSLTYSNNSSTDLDKE